MEVGELWFIKAVDEGHPKTMVVVYDKAENHTYMKDPASCPYVACAFADTDIDLADDIDIVFQKGEVAPWVVRICCDLIGPVPKSSFVERIGIIPQSDPDALHDAIEHHAFTEDYVHRLGMPMTLGDEDPRWKAKEDRLDELWEHYFYISPDEGEGEDA